MGYARCRVQQLVAVILHAAQDEPVAAPHCGTVKLPRSGTMGTYTLLLKP